MTSGALAGPQVPFLGLGPPGQGGVSTCIFTWESISLLLRWLFSSEKICESFLKVDNRSLGVGGGQERCQGSAAGEAGAAPGRTSCPGAPPPTHRLTAPQLRLSRYMGFDCRADRIARREEKFRSSLQRCEGGGCHTPSLIPSCHLPSHHRYELCLPSSSLRTRPPPHLQP